MDKINLLTNDTLHLIESAQALQKKGDMIGALQLLSQSAVGQKKSLEQKLTSKSSLNQGEAQILDYIHSMRNKIAEYWLKERNTQKSQEAIQPVCDLALAKKDPKKISEVELKALGMRVPQLQKEKKFKELKTYYTILSGQDCIPQSKFLSLMGLYQLKKMENPESMYVKVYHQLAQMTCFNVIVQQISQSIKPVGFPQLLICRSDYLKAHYAFNHLVEFAFSPGGEIPYGAIMDSRIGELCLGSMGNWTRSNAKHVPILLINSVLANIKKLLGTPHAKKIPAILSFLEINLEKLVKNKKITKDSQAQFNELKKLYELICTTKDKRQECKTLQKIDLLLKKPTVHPHYTLKEVNEITAESFALYSSGKKIRLAEDYARSVIMQQQHEGQKAQERAMLGIIETDHGDFANASINFDIAAEEIEQLSTNMRLT